MLSFGIRVETVVIPIAAASSISFLCITANSSTDSGGQNSYRIVRAAVESKRPVGLPFSSRSSPAIPLGIAFKQ